MSSHFPTECFENRPSSWDWLPTHTEVNETLAKLEAFETAPPEIRETTPPTISEGLEQRFWNLANQWHKETRLTSSVAKMVMHPAYQQIIGMGAVAIPFILRDLRATRDHWLWALRAIVGDDPSPEGASFDEAVDAWLAWGKKKKYI